MPRILGPALISTRQQRALKEGALFAVPRSSVYETAADQAQPGDLFWVREPFAEITPMRFNCPQWIHAILPGSGPLEVTIPPRIVPYFDRCHMRFKSGAGMRRAESRAALEIVALSDAGFKCRVRMGNVDAAAEGCAA